MMPALNSNTARQQNLNHAVRGVPKLPFRRQRVSAKLVAQLSRQCYKHSSIFGVSVQKLLSASGCQSRRVNEAMKVQAFMGGNSVDPIRIAIQIVSIVIAGAVAWVMNQPTQLEKDTRSDAQACPRCNGTGYEPCWCQSWSDGDVGCNSCNRSGYMACRSCGGGGIATPLPVKVNLDRR